ncbi:PilN domain-containing protein [Aliikangiella maris]|uniref:PilN domain-containing protein n=2 Tax=Aliikangiella maris TaxID=3162458 RepID=A0ABV3MQC9_9GAMM
MQTINFYFAEYRPKPLSFDTQFAAILLGVSILSMSIIGFIQSSQLNQLTAINQLKKQQLDKIQAETIQLQKQLNQKQTLQSLDSQIANQKELLIRYRQILNQVGNPAQTQLVLYSDVFSQLAEQKDAGVWLTKISIEKNNLSLEGSSTESISIPKYIDQLKTAPALKRQFDELKVQRDQNNTQIINFALLNGRIASEG